MPDNIERKIIKRRLQTQLSSLSYAYLHGDPDKAEYFKLQMIAGIPTAGDDYRRIPHEIMTKFEEYKTEDPIYHVLIGGIVDALRQIIIDGENPGVIQTNYVLALAQVANQEREKFGEKKSYPGVVWGVGFDTAVNKYNGNSVPSD
ncbi:hypothetical protein KBD69_02460 [Candidatus Woesebacteria bacterium]|nr:hypothetical protein [Candidatus Woesebacteria bacterium]